MIAGGEGGRVGVWRSDDGKGRREGVRVEECVAHSDRPALSPRATCAHVYRAASAVSCQCSRLPSS